MSDLAGTGSAVSVAVLATALKTAETAAATQVEVLDGLLESQADLMSEVLRLLNVGTQVDLTA